MTFLTHTLQRAWVLLVLGWPVAGFAGPPPNWTELEMNAAGQFCYYSQSFPGFKPNAGESAAADRWRGTLGGAYLHVHHYCWARMSVARSMRGNVPPNARKALRSNALIDYNYFIERVPADFFMLPEVLMHRGETLMLLEQYANAERDFRKATELRPDFWPPYERWISMLVNQGQKKLAIDVVKEALRHAPQANALRNHAKRLGVELPPPDAKPITASTPTSEPAAASAPAPAP